MTHRKDTIMKKYYLEFTTQTHTGLKRDHNEDACAAYSHGLLVADGVGGSLKGEQASTYIAEEFLHHFIHNSTTEVKETIDNMIISTRKRLHENFSWAETTFISAIIEQNIIHVSWLGDSRGYIFRDNNLVPITKDHSHVQDLVESGVITQEEAFNHPHGNIVTKIINSDYSGHKYNEPDHSTYDIKENDIILLCTDGLTDLIRDHDIENMMIQHQDNLHDMSDSLIHSALTVTEEGLIAGKDNITIALGKVHEENTNSYYQDPEIITFYEEKES